MKITGSLLICIVVLFLSFSSIGQNTKYHRELERILQNENQVDFSIVPGVIILSVDDQFVSLDTFGQIVQQAPQQSNPDIWELGSVSKPVTAWLAEKALDQLGLSLSAAVCKVLPDSLCQGGWSQLTFGQILDHQAGLPLISPQMAQLEKDVEDPYRDYDIQYLARDMQSAHPVAGQYSYSHLGYAALYWLFQKVGGLEKFANEQLLTKHISMKADVQSINMVTGHGLNGKETSAWHTQSLLPAIGWKSSVHSLYNFITLWFPESGADILTVTSEFKKEELVLKKKDAYKIEQGWFVFRSGKSIVYFQNGHTGGQYVSVAFMPAEKKAVIVAANGVSGTRDLSLSVLRMLKRAKKK